MQRAAFIFVFVLLFASMVESHQGTGANTNCATFEPCAEGQTCQDTDAPSGQQWMACEAGVFVTQGGTGGGGVSAMGDFESFYSADATQYTSGGICVPNLSGTTVTIAAFCCYTKGGTQTTNIDIVTDPSASGTAACASDVSADATGERDCCGAFADDTIAAGEEICWTMGATRTLTEVGCHVEFSP